MVATKDNANDQFNSLNRVQVVRPERILNSEKYLFIKISDLELELIDYSSFGLSVLSEKPLSNIFPETNMINASIIFNNISLQTADIVPVYETKLNNSLYKIAFEIRHAPLNVEMISASVEALQTFSEVTAKLELSSKILPEIKVIVSDVHALLSGLKDSLSDLESQWEQLDPSDRSNREIGTAKVVAAKFGEIAWPIFRYADQLLNKVSDEEDKILHLRFIRENLGSLLFKAPFANRSFFKPSGYAGDFEMMNQIYRNQLEGADLFSKCLHRFFVDQDAAKAVQNRSVYLHKKIEQNIEKCQGTPLRILSLACGPAFEISNILETVNPELNFEVVLLDQDVRALQNAQRGIREVLIRRNLKNVKIDYRIQSVKHVLTRGLKDERGYDFMYSSGLFDYLADDIAIATMKRMFAALKPGGDLLIGNFSTSNPNRSIMEICLDWNLIYRSDEDMERLARAVADNVVVESEDLGVNLFVILKK